MDVRNPHPAHAQSGARVRLEWGPVGAEVLAAPLSIVVDVLSFTTTLAVAVERGISVYPFRWADDRAASYAASRDALLAVGRRVAGPGEVSLSPGSVRAAADVRRLVLPSPNGSAISLGLAERGARVVGASLRNRTAVARRVAAELAAGLPAVAVLPCGERWPDGSLRPAVEDLWGAGAVIAALVDLGVGGLSPEARVAEQAFRAVEPRLAEELAACASGQELVAGGFADDVAVAAELDAGAAVPVLVGEAFEAFEAAGN